MKVKRYVAPDMQEAMLKVKMDLGKEAIILHTRKYKEGGFFGLFGRTMVEITAAVEDHPINTAAATVARQNRTSVTALASYAEASRIDHLQDELQAMREMVTQIAGQVQTGTAASGKAGEEGSGMAAGSKALGESQNPWPEELTPLFKILLENEIEEKLAGDLLKKAVSVQSEQDDNESCEGAAVGHNGMGDGGGQDPLEKARGLVEKEICRILKTPKPISLNGSSKAIALVGPTGVGKTTTIAKLAATFSLMEKKNIALVTADTYRIAAVEQLKTYSEIIGLPIDVAYTPAELKEAVQRHKDKDLILIDTAGRSHRNLMQMTELRAFLDAAEPNEVFMVLSATSKYRDMLEVMESYNDIPFSRIVFTKLDETSSCGAILNLVHRCRKMLSYTTAGQNVPDDISVADPAELARMMVRER